MRFRSGIEGSTSDLQFHSKTDQWIVDAFEHGVRSFEGILRNVSGYYPGDVLRSIIRLQKEGRVSRGDLGQVLEEVSTERRFTRDIGRLPDYLEHPVDFEWWYTRDSVRRICDQLRGLNLGGDSNILCIGCPSLYAFGQAQPLEQKLLLWDKNSQIHSRFLGAQAISSVDVMCEVLPRVQASAAIIDPPWYNDYYGLFSWAAIQCIPLGGYILSSFPPEGTRPSVSEDFKSVSNTWDSMGLRIIKRLPNYLAYRSPYFEVNALKAVGIVNFPLDWRPGDLIVLSKEEDTKVQRPRVTQSVDEWLERRIGNTRFKVRLKRFANCSTCASVSESEILPSVSARHPLRKLANVVTSGNRFLRCRNPDQLIQCLDYCVEYGTMPTYEMDDVEQRHLITVVKDIVEKEDREFNTYQSLSYGL